LNLNKKNILLIMPFYFEYEKQIEKCLSRNGANVWSFNENINKNYINRFFSIYCKKVYKKAVNISYDKLLKNLPQHMDYVFIIKGSTITYNYVQKLKKIYCQAKFIMYQWDSVANYQKALELSKWCDYNFSFDPDDSIKYGWKYRALFFDPELCILDKEKRYDLTFICSLHSERAKLYRAIKNFSKEREYKFYGYLFTDKMSYFRQKYLNHNPKFDVQINNLKFSPLSQRDISSIYDVSKCLVDYKFDNQMGLTMRSIESLGHSCKLLTNNHNIKKEDFYNPNNIYVYDMESIDIPEDFLLTEYESVDQHIYHKYSIQGWVEEIFNFVEQN